MLSDVDLEPALQEVYCQKVIVRSIHS
jgi:hypothetical protein